MTYVNAERVDLRERERVDWRFRAQANLIAATRTELWTHERRDASGNIIFVAMMQHDGMGPLCGELLRRSDLRVVDAEAAG